MIKRTAVPWFPPVRVGVLLVTAMLLIGCVLKPTKPPPRLLHGGLDVQVADVDVLGLTPAMHDFLERYVLSYRNPETRLRMLSLAVTSSGVLGFDYDEAHTLTAAEAFATRTGNCIGFANMMVALAREAGLEASYQQVYRRPEWSSREDTVLLVKHINVVVSSPQRSWVVDVSGIKFRAGVRRQIISDANAKALYFNNLGAEALLQDDLVTAWAYLDKSIGAAPLLADPWVNMGVVFGRNEQLHEAEIAYRSALKIDRSEYSAMSNLYEVYLAQEDLQAAEELRVRVEEYRRQNPYYLMKLSEELLVAGRFEEATALLQHAIRKKDDDHLLYFALAKTQYLSGDFVAAQHSLQQARDLSPSELLGYYDRSWQELVRKDQEEN